MVYASFVAAAADWTKRTSHSVSFHAMFGDQTLDR